MPVFRTSSLGDFTRGGQTGLHFFRMIRQVIHTITYVSIILILLLTAFFIDRDSSRYELYVTGRWALAEGFMAIGAKTGTSPFEMPDGKIVQAKNIEVVNDPYVNRVVSEVGHIAIKALVKAVLSVLGFAVFVTCMIWIWGRRQRTEEHLRGGEVVDASVLSDVIKQRKMAGDFRLVTVPMLKNSETSHILISGSPGGGKSVALRDLMKQVRARKQRGIVYDVSGQYIKHFYREGKDVILNPMDARCPAWSVWAEAREPADFDNMAAALIAEPKGATDPFWVEAARILFSTVAYQMSMREDRSTRTLLRDLLALDLKDMLRMVKGTVAASILAEGAEKTALSVRSTLVTNVRSLMYTRSGGDEFSIRKWIENDGDDSWIFVSARPDHMASLRPLITMWMDVASSSLMSLDEDRQRRVWTFFDELPSLNKLPSLEDNLAMSRKFGGCVVLGFQSYSQLKSVYGVEGAETIAGLCSSWVVYRYNEPETAEWIAKSLGSQEVLEKAEGISYGANEIRDGVSLSASRKMRQLVLPTEITNLPDLSGYIRVPGDFPVAKFEMSYVAFPVVAAPFVRAVFDPASWDLSPPKDADLAGECDVAVPSSSSEDLYRTTLSAPSSPVRGELNAVD